MSIRHALRRQSETAALRPTRPRLAARGRGRVPAWWCSGSNAILAMLAAAVAVVFAIEILHG